MLSTQPALTGGRLFVAKATCFVAIPVFATNRGLFSRSGVVVAGAKCHSRNLVSIEVLDASKRSRGTALGHSRHQWAA